LKRFLANIVTSKMPQEHLTIHAMCLAGLRGINLKVGNFTNLYNRNVIQGIYRGSDSNRDSYGYIDVVSQGLPGQYECLQFMSNRKGVVGRALTLKVCGMRVWYRAGDCPLGYSCSRVNVAP
jgi:hypothetical protein